MLDGMVNLERVHCAKVEKKSRSGCVFLSVVQQSSYKFSS
jgi:hypothetical protein